MPIAIEDIVIDPKNVARNLNHACNSNHHNYRICGVCQIETTAYFVLLPLTPTETREDYTIAPVDDLSNDGFIAELENRWEAGFNTISTIDLGNNSMVYLLAKPRT